MKIALTGGTGFIGSHFLKQSLQNEHNILAIRRNIKSRPNIILEKEPTWIDKQMNAIKARDLSECDVLVHLAAHTGNIPYDTLKNCLYWNVTTVLNLFEEARLAGIKRYVVAGSCFEYGRSGERYEKIPSCAPLEPTNSYAASKAASTVLRLSLEILRVFHVYGEGEPQKRLWPSLRNAALNGNDFPMTLGNQIRDFQPVEAVAYAFLSRATKLTYQNKASVYNLGTDKPKTIRQFAEEWWYHWGASGKLLFGDIPYRDNEVMSYIPKVDISIR